MVVTAEILVVDDDKEMGELLKDFLKKEGFGVHLENTARNALAWIKENEVDLVITDIKMPDMTGMQLLKEIKKIKSFTQVIMITAFGSIESAIEALKEGAYYYITKPFKMNEILITVNKALEKKSLEQENISLRSEVEKKYSFGNIIGKSKVMQRIFDLIKTVSCNNSNIIIYGESGTGKELVAKAIHYNSLRREKPFVPINCTAIPEGLLESELFGHLKGAFTGAVGSKKGLFEKADGGTLFLDEIGDMGLGLQGKLLRAIQDREIRPVGSIETVKIDVRIIAATNKKLLEEIEQKRFREDLYYRLSVIPIHLPSLNERLDDIPLLVEHFLSKHKKEYGREVKGISKEALNLLMRPIWRGNVRELENVIERAVVLSNNEILDVEDIPLPGETKLEDLLPASLAKHMTLDEFENQYISAILKEVDGNKQMAAEILGISCRTLYRKEKDFFKNKP